MGCQRGQIPPPHLPPPPPTPARIPWKQRKATVPHTPPRRLPTRLLTELFARLWQGEPHHRRRRGTRRRARRARTKAQAGGHGHRGDEQRHQRAGPGRAAARRFRPTVRNDTMPDPKNRFSMRQCLVSASPMTAPRSVRSDSRIPVHATPSSPRPGHAARPDPWALGRPPQCRQGSLARREPLLEAKGVRSEPARRQVHAQVAGPARTPIWHPFVKRSSPRRAR